MKSAEIAVSEWLDALNDAEGKKSDVGMAAFELAEAWGVCSRTALERIRSLHRAGMVKVGHRQGVSMEGKRTRVPVYTISRPKKGRK